MTSGQMILLGLMLLAVAFTLRRSFSMSKASRRRDPLAEARAEIREAETSHAAVINKMEIKLHDYGREVDGRIETQLTMLNRLLIEADQKIAKLESLAAQPSITPAIENPAHPTRKTQQTIHRLADAGMSVDQISAETGEPASHIRLILKMRSRTSGSDAAGSDAA